MVQSYAVYALMHRLPHPCKPGVWDWQGEPAPNQSPRGRPELLSLALPLAYQRGIVAWQLEFYEGNVKF